MSIPSRRFEMQPSPSSLAHRARRRLSAGLTLIELIVVLVIIGVLDALIVPKVLDRADDASSKAERTDVTKIMQEIKI